MTFKECKDLVKKYNLDLNKCVVAYEVNQVLGNKINDYEKVCGYIYSCSLDTENSIGNLVIAFKDLLDDGYTEEEIIELREYKFIEKASYYF